MNSTLTATELAGRVREANGRDQRVAFRGVMLATAAMLVRNAILLVLLAPETLVAASIPIALMLGAAGFQAWKSPLDESREALDGSPSGKPEGESRAAGETVELTSPFSLFAALEYGVIFLVLEIVGTLAQRALGQFGFYVVSALGGLVSSASAVAAAANIARGGTTSAGVAASGAVIASMASVLVNWPLAWRVSRDRWLGRRLLRGLLLVVVAGVIGELVRFALSQFG